MGGRKKGSQNKITKTVKETVLKVFNKLQKDPVNNLTEFAKKYPRDFYAIAAKLIPTEISGKDGGEILMKIITKDQETAEELQQLRIIHSKTGTNDAQ